MPDLYLEPVFYGVQDVVLPGGRAARIIFPSDDGAVFEAPIRTGTYPLVVFIHGDREIFDDLCPSDLTQDYKAWLPVLHLLARCGFVVIAPDVSDVVSEIDAGAVVVEEAVNWMHFEWQERSVLWYAGQFVDPVSYRKRDEADLRDHPLPNILHLGEGIGSDMRPSMGLTTPVGLAGHSWGVRICARAAARGNVGATALASIAGVFDDNDAAHNFVDVSRPTLMMAGTEDLQNASYLTRMWDRLTSPKYQALLQGLGHWDWFTTGIHPCDKNAPKPACNIGWFTAAELLLGFMTKHLQSESFIPPTLLGPPGNRVPLQPYYAGGGPCALKVRWSDPQFQGVVRQLFTQLTFGNWTASGTW